MKDLEKLMQ